MSNQVDISKLHSVIVNAVVEKDGKILVSQRSFEEAHEPGKWTIPGGKIDKTEGNIFNIIEKTCAREIEEETGIKIKENIQLMTNNTFIRSNGQHVIALICLCHWESGEAQALEDTIGIKWISKDEIDKFDFAPNVKGYIEMGFEKLNKMKV
ncbi:MAG: NUDIX domain-containing protein [Candidatus Shapirobacteria bacterium]|jgi:ADP-ribose pyrophosphatase YjhB (NUDIX family)